MAWRIVIAQVCRKRAATLASMREKRNAFSAVRTCFLRMYSNPARVIHPSRALINSSGANSPLIDSQARSADAVSFHSRMQRSLRPFPWTRTLGSGWNLTSTTRTPTDLRISVVYDFAHFGERLPAPVAEFLDPRVDYRRGRFHRDFSMYSSHSRTYFGCSAQPAPSANGRRSGSITVRKDGSPDIALWVRTMFPLDSSHVHLATITVISSACS